MVEELNIIIIKYQIEKIQYISICSLKNYIGILLPISSFSKIEHNLDLNFSVSPIFQNGLNSFINIFIYSIYGSYKLLLFSPQFSNYLLEDTDPNQQILNNNFNKQYDLNCLLLDFY